MGLNMLSAPKCDDISTIWDTRSNECAQTTPVVDINQNEKSDTYALEYNCSHCESDATAAVGEEYLSVPSICDLDVRVVNSYIQNQLKKSN